MQFFFLIDVVLFFCKEKKIWLRFYRSGFLNRDRNHSPNSHKKEDQMARPWVSCMGLLLTSTGVSALSTDPMNVRNDPSKSPVLKPPIHQIFWGENLTCIHIVWKMKDFKFLNVSLGSDFCSFYRKSHLYYIQANIFEKQSIYRVEIHFFAKFTDYVFLKRGG